MKHLRQKSGITGFLLIGAVCLLIAGQTALFADPKDPKPKNEHYKVVVEPEEAVVEVGQSVAFSAHLEDKSGNRQEGDFTWSTTGRETGFVDENGVFTGTSGGQCQVVATSGKSSGKARVEVIGDDTRLALNVVVEPNSAVLAVGDTLQFSAWLTDSTGVRVDTVFTWSVKDAVLGQVDETGLFVALADGNTFVEALVGNRSGKAHVRITGEKKLTHRWGNILIYPPEPVIAVGDSLRFTATLLDTQGVRIDTVFAWSLSNEGCGTISEDGHFQATDRGNSFVYATLGDISGRARVVVQDSAHFDERKDGELVIVPADTVIGVGGVINYRAVFVYSTGVRVDTVVQWDALGRDVGDMTEDGVFTASSAGTGLIRAKMTRYLAMTRVMVAGMAVDTSGAGVDSVQFRFRYNGDSVGDTTGQEGQTVFTFSGLPYPMSMLNGGQVIFPPGSLNEQISIDVTMPNFSLYETDSTLSYGDLILNGVSFHVYIGDSLASPYHFDPPANLVLPFDTTLMSVMGMTPDDIWMFFYTEQNGLDTTGIFNVVVDDVNGKIYADVSHFSTLAVAGKNGQGVTAVGEDCCPADAAVPQQHRLYENYPNPFNPETVIRFDLAGSGTENIRLSVYNILGQELKVLMEGPYRSGSYRARWDGTNHNGQAVGSGIYIYRLQAGRKAFSRRMILLR